MVETLYPELAQHGPETVEPTRAVIGLGADQSFRRADCCQPLPGERIVGITYRGQGRGDPRDRLPALEEFEEEPERWVDLHWQPGQHPPAYTASLKITISNDAGVLGHITLIGQQKANISDLHFIDRKPDFYSLVVEVELRDVEHLHMLLTALEAETDVAQVERWRDIAQALSGPEGTADGGNGPRKGRRTTVVFKRRNKRPFLQALREAVWPRGGWTRAFHYIRHRLNRLPDRPERIARGIFSGVLISFTPLFGFHLGGAVAALAAGARQHHRRAFDTLIGNPLTFPLIALVSIKLGHWMLGHHARGPDRGVVRDLRPCLPRPAPQSDRPVHP